MYFAGDDTLGGYSGALKEFIINLQLNLRTVIATEDAFPKSVIGCSFGIEHQFVRS